MAIPDKKFVYTALIQENYFPAQKRDPEELPPVFSTRGLSESICQHLLKMPLRNSGYDAIDYKLTRFNNVPRYLSIPHPLPYISLANCIADNWDKLEFTAKNKESQIKPKKHPDGRIIIMDYENPLGSARNNISLSFGKKFVVHTDIANCFPSIYSHSIPWALVGIKKAKTNRDQKLWFNQIDYYQRLLRRNETLGLPIGPATSNVVCEAILGKIDNVLRQEGFIFSREGGHSRYIDDYTAYFNSYKSAEDFIRVLSYELSDYKLRLNIKKTSIDRLPSPLSSSWVSDISTRLTASVKLSKVEAIRFLDYAVSKQSETPDGSILKFMIKSLLSKVSLDNGFLKYLLNLSFHYPIILPIFYSRLPNLNLLKPFKQELMSILKVCTEMNYSDGMAWCIYYLNFISCRIHTRIVRQILKTGDCFPILLVYLSRKHNDLIADFVNGLLNEKDLFAFDQYWLLLYQLFLDGEIANPYLNQQAYSGYLKSKRDTFKDAMSREVQVFDYLKSNSVSFVI